MMFSAVCTTALQVGHRCAPAPVSTAVSRSSPVFMASKYTDASGQEIKSALSAYMHFCQERRAPLTATLKASMGASFANTMVMKELGAEWKVLDATSKERFAGVATSDKVRSSVPVPARPRPNAHETHRSSSLHCDPPRGRRASTRRWPPTRRTLR
mgnify:CR=1 FL=1